MEPLIVTLAPVAGLVLNVWIFYSVWELFRHSRIHGPVDRGLVIKTQPLDPALVRRLRSSLAETEVPWGWYRREGDVLLVYVDPYYGADGHLRLRFVDHVAVVNLDPGNPTIAYRVPLGITVLFLPVTVLFFPMFFMVRWMHRALVSRILERVESLALQSV